MITLLGLLVLVQACSGPTIRGTGTSSGSPVESRRPSLSGSPATGRPRARARVDAASEVAGAARRTLATSARVDVVDLIPGMSVVDTVNMNGRFDFSTDSGALTVTVPEASVGDRVTREVLTPTTLYVKAAPDSGSGLPPGKWGRLPRSQVQPHAILRTSANDPAPWLREVSELRNGTVVGTDIVNGGAAQHVHGTLTIATVERYGGAFVVAQIDRFPVPLSVTVDAWIDSHQRITQIAFTAGPQDGSSGPPTRLQIDLTAYGTPAKDAAPPSDQTVALRRYDSVLLG
jgi:hypothetical protein